MLRIVKAEEKHILDIRNLWTEFLKYSEEFHPMFAIAEGAAEHMEKNFLRPAMKDKTCGHPICRKGLTRFHSKLAGNVPVRVIEAPAVSRKAGPGYLGPAAGLTRQSGPPSSGQPAPLFPWARQQDSTGWRLRPPG